MNFFSCYHWFQVYMYDFMFVDPETIPEGKYIPYIRNFAQEYKKKSTPGSIPKHWLGFIYIHSEYCELDLNYY